MNIKELAEKLNCREAGNEITGAEHREAEENNILVVYGYSDDLMELRGIVYDEVGVYDGGIAYFDGNKLLENECDDEDCIYFSRLKENAEKIEAIWDEEGIAWSYKTELPHETFDIMEDGEVWCRGIIIQF